MSDFLSAILAFPTVIFTILLGVVGVYWLLVLLGAADLDPFDIGDGGDLDLDGDGEADGLGGVVRALGLDGVPLTLAASAVVLVAWVLCLVAMQALGGGASGWIAAAAAVAAFAVAVPVAALAVRPFKRVFVSHPAPTSRALVGKVCTISTLTVDERHGQAELDDGGAGLLLPVRCAPENRGLLKRGDRAVIYDYKDEVFHVAPLDQVLEQSLKDVV